MHISFEKYSSIPLWINKETNTLTKDHNKNKVMDLGLHITAFLQLDHPKILHLVLYHTILATVLIIENYFIFCRKYGRFHMIIWSCFTVWVFKLLPWWRFRYLMSFYWYLHETTCALYIMTAFCEHLTVLSSVNHEVWGLCGIISFYCQSG